MYHSNVRAENLPQPKKSMLTTETFHGCWPTDCRQACYSLFSTVLMERGGLSLIRVRG